MLPVNKGGVMRKGARRKKRGYYFNTREQEEGRPAVVTGNDFATREHTKVCLTETRQADFFVIIGRVFLLSPKDYFLVNTKPWNAGIISPFDSVAAGFANTPTLKA